MSDSGSGDDSDGDWEKTPSKRKGAPTGHVVTPVRKSPRGGGTPAALPLVTLTRGKTGADAELSTWLGPCVAIATQTGLPVECAPHVARALAALIGEVPEGCTRRLFYAAIHELIGGGGFIDPETVRGAIAVEEARSPKAHHGHTAEGFVLLLAKEPTDAARAFLAKLIDALANEPYTIYALPTGARHDTTVDVAFILVDGKLAPCAARGNSALPVLRATTTRVAGEMTPRDVEFVLRCALNALKGCSGDIECLTTILKELVKRRALITHVGRELADALSNFAFLPGGLGGFLENVALTGLVTVKVSALARLLLAQLESAAAVSPSMLIPASWNAADRALGGGMPRSGEGQTYLLGFEYHPDELGISGATWDKGRVRYTPGSRRYTISSASGTVKLEGNPHGALYGPFPSQRTSPETCTLLSLRDIAGFGMLIHTQCALIVSTAPGITKEELLGHLTVWLMSLRDTTLTPQTLAVHAPIIDCAALGILVFVLDPRAVTINCNLGPHLSSNIDRIMAALLALRLDGNTVDGAGHDPIYSTAEFGLSMLELLWRLSHDAHESERPPQLTTIAITSDGHTSAELANMVDCMASFLTHAAKCGNPVAFFLGGIADIGDECDDAVADLLREQAVRNLKANESGMPGGTAILIDPPFVARCRVLLALADHLAFMAEKPSDLYVNTGNQASGAGHVPLELALAHDAASIPTVTHRMFPTACGNCTPGAGDVACATCAVAALVRAGHLDDFWPNAPTLAKQNMLAGSSDVARRAAIDKVRSEPHNKAYGNIKRALELVVPRDAIPDAGTFVGRVTLDRPHAAALHEWPGIAGRLFHRDPGFAATWDKLTQ
jgi:hypothetical protein